MNQELQAVPAVTGPPVGDRRRPAFYNVAETAEIMRIDESTLYRHLRGGTFPGVKIGGRYVVPHVALERLIEDVLAAGACVDVADWTSQWRAAQQAAAQSRALAAGGVSW